MSPKPEQISIGQNIPEVIASDEEGHLISFLVDGIDNLKNKIAKHYGIETKFSGILIDTDKCVHPIVETKIEGNQHGTLVVLAGEELKNTFPLVENTVDWGNNKGKESYERFTVKEAKEEKILDEAGDRNVIILHNDEFVNEDVVDRVAEFIDIISANTDTREHLDRTRVLFLGLKKASGISQS